MKSYKIGKILENKKIATDIWLMKVETKLEAKPGEFFMFRTDSFRNEPLLSRPFGVCDENPNELSFLYQVVGKGTEIMAGLRKDTEVKLLGPLGHGFTLKNPKKIAVVAGGIGIAPLLYLCKKLEVKPDFYAGFSAEEYFVDEFRPFVNKVVTTVDKRDHKFITEAINPDDYDLIYACGPNPMLQALCDKNTKAEIQVSMEAHMACGIGACLGCTVESTNGEFLRVCKDGPVFDSKEVF
ncbi:MAG: dihydroorotate dehydrogenase electron transfer subunit [Anaerococcus sp.]|jgi:dihydroorotate dehydrogenase electron transfer subunit|nr:dihydroorotate dehydrogenase electron transfer subunit [Peptoniphilaceae bacterium]MDY3055930.1 dihydroorotate dehydrogenase electron transfer subunit [Anaerococcus sp.]